MALMRRLIAGAAGLVAAAAASAHDTWFEWLPRDQAAGGVALALGTGNRFPVHETPIYAEHLAATGCRTHSGEQMSLRAARTRANAIWLRSTVAPEAQPTCWAQVAPVEITLPAATVALYLKEVNAPAAVREAWAAQQARGVAWQERYTKHARIERLRAGVAATAQPVPMGMDVLLRSDAPVAVGTRLTLQVLRNGQPVPNLAVELCSEQTRYGIWRQTDAQGRVEFAPPLAGRWLLRGTELRASVDKPDVWDSGFVTLAFDVAAAPLSGQ
jgi:hypothetical protein